MAKHQLTAVAQQEIAREYLRITREDFERALRVRNLHIKNARFYGLPDSEIETELGLREGAIVEASA